MKQAPQGLVSVSEIVAYVRSDTYMPFVETCEYLGLAERTVRMLLPEIKHYRVGRKLLFKKSELDSWIQKYQETTEDLDLDRVADEALRSVLGGGK